MRRLVVFILAALLAAAFVAPVSAGESSRWDRLNPGNPPEHEQLSCVGTTTLRCLYDKLPEPTLGFHWDRTKGVFVGQLTTDPGACPVGLVDGDGRDLCAGGAVRSVFAGATTYVAPDGSLSTWQESLIFTSGSDGWAPLYMFLAPFGVACPWYGTFAAALAANPSASFDCLVLP